MAKNNAVEVYSYLKRTRNNKNFHVVQRDNPKMYEDNMKETASFSATSNQITVTGMGEMVLPPNCFAVTIRCKAIKENMQDAKTSVTRRVDYIIQTLKNHSLTEDAFKIYTHAGHQETQAHCETEIEVNFMDVNKCLQVSNLLAEKLGPGVYISLPLCYFTPGSLDKLRKQASMLAIYNARQKALEMSKVIHLTVGQAIQVQENCSEESLGTCTSDSEQFDFNTGIQRRISDKTVRICSKVSVCFQLKPGRGKRL